MEALELEVQGIHARLETTQHAIDVEFASVKPLIDSARTRLVSLEAGVTNEISAEILQSTKSAPIQWKALAEAICHVFSIAPKASSKAKGVDWILTLQTYLQDASLADRLSSLDLATCTEDAITQVERSLQTASFADSDLASLPTIVGAVYHFLKPVPEW